MTESTEATVRALITASGLHVSPDEFASLVASYPALRRSLDALYSVPMLKEEEPQTVFTPLA